MMADLGRVAAAAGVVGVRLGAEHVGQRQAGAEGADLGGSCGG